MYHKNGANMILCKRLSTYSNFLLKKGFAKASTRGCFFKDCKDARMEIYIFDNNVTVNIHTVGEYFPKYDIWKEGTFLIDTERKALKEYNECISNGLWIRI